MAIERTLIIIKPDGVQRGLVGEILNRLERRGLKIVGLDFRTISEETASTHYGEHKGKPFYESLLAFLTSGPTVAMVWEGREAVVVGRNLMGLTDGAKARHNCLGKGQFS